MVPDDAPRDTSELVVSADTGNDDILQRVFSNARLTELVLRAAAFDSETSASGLRTRLQNGERQATEIAQHE